MVERTEVLDEKRDFWTEMLYNLVWFVNFFAVFSIPAVILGRAANFPLAPLLLLGGIIPFYINFFARRKIAQGFYRFMVQLIVPAIVTALSIALFHPVIAVVLIVYVLAMVAFSLWQYSATEQVLLEPGVVLTMALVHIALFFMTWLFGGTIPAWSYFFTLSIIYIGSTIHNHLAQVDMALEAHNAPKAVIKQILTNDKTLTVMLAGALVGMLLVMSLAFIPMFNVAGRFIVPPSPNWVFPLDLEGGDYPINVLPPQNVEGRGYFIGPRADMYIAIALVVSVALFFFVLPRLVRLGIAFVHSRNTKFQGYKVGDAEERSFNLKFKKKRRRLADMWADIAPVRREFRNTVRKHMKAGVPIVQTDTPTDMAVAIEESEDIYELAKSYSRARYGKEELVAGGRFARRK